MLRENFQKKWIYLFLKFMFQSQQIYTFKINKKVKFNNICFQIETYVYQINCNSRDLMVALLEWFAPYLLLWWFLNPFKVLSTFGGRQVAQWIRHFINGLLQAWVQIHTPFTFSGFIWSTLHSIVLFCVCLYLNCENEQKIEKNWPTYVGQ